MINPDVETIFPNNVVKCLLTVLPGVDVDAVVFPRPLRPTDPNYSISCYATLWQPNEQTQEIGHAVPGEPTLSEYQIGIQTLIKDGEADRGLAISSIFTKRVRSVLYRNQPLRVALGSLYATDGLSRESLKRWGIRSQRFMSNDINGDFVTISVVDFWIETEMS